MINRIVSTVRSVLFPLVSIIIPTYNRKDFLMDAIQSCLRQTYPNLEVIIVDDGSTDGTEKHVKTMINKNWQGRVIYCQGIHAGVSYARNRGVHLAKGEFIQFLDSDDLLMPDKIKRQLEIIKTSLGEVDVCLCYGRMGPKDQPWEEAKRIGVHCCDWQAYLEELCSRTIHVIHTSAPLWRRPLLMKGGEWRDELVHSEEWEYYIRLIALKPKVGFVEEDLFWIRAHEGDQLSKDSESEEHWRSVIQAHKCVLDTLKRNALLNEQHQNGLLSRARSIYINVLRRMPFDVIRDFEKWYMTLARKPRPHLSVILMIWIRRITGRRLLVGIYDTLKKTVAISLSVKSRKERFCMRLFNLHVTRKRSE